MSIGDICRETGTQFHCRLRSTVSDKCQKSQAGARVEIRGSGIWFGLNTVIFERLWCCLLKESVLQKINFIWAHCLFLNWPFNGCYSDKPISPVFLMDSWENYPLNSLTVCKFCLNKTIKTQEVVWWCCGVACKPSSFFNWHPLQWCSLVYFSGHASKRPAKTQQVVQHPTTPR